MSRIFGTRIVLFVVASWLAGVGAWCAFAEAPQAKPEAKPSAAADALEKRCSTVARPFLERYCLSCHGSRKPKADLDLSDYSTANAVANNPRQWELVLERLQAQEMPPEKAPRRPKADERA